jgi:dihydrofolate reductase
MKSIVVAHDCGGVIGFEGSMPWEGRMPADMAHFRRLTKEHAVVMGRKTFESIGRPLLHRQNIVVSHKKLRIKGCEVVGSVDAAFDLVESGRDTFVIGGSQIYKLALPLVDELRITKIQANFKGDAFFVDINPDEWQLHSSEVHRADAENDFDYAFCHYKRRLHA